MSRYWGDSIVSIPFPQLGLSAPPWGRPTIGKVAGSRQRAAGELALRAVLRRPTGMNQERQSRYHCRRIILALITVHAFLLAWGAYRHSPTIDETAHLPSGLSHWEFRRFDLYAVNPPLVRMVAAIPVLFSDAKRDWSLYTTDRSHRQEFVVGRDFVRLNGDRIFWYFTIARWACIPFSILGALMCARWAGQLYGEWASVGAATLWCFSPTVLGHGQLITPDVGAAAVGLAASYAYWRFMTRPTPKQAVVAGVALGAAWLTKATLLIFGIVWPVLWCLDRCVLRRHARRSPRLGELVPVFLIAILVVHLGYGFEGSFTRLGDIDFISRLGVTRDGTPRFSGHWTGEIPLPLPENYVRGIDRQKADFEAGWESYLRGEWRKGGWWYYYLYGLAVKMPAGLFVLLAVGGVLIFLGLPVTRDEWYLIVPAATVIAFVSSQTGFNHHIRYVLPAIPFLFVFACRVFGLLKPPRGVCREWIVRPRWHRLVGAATAFAFSWFVVSSLSVYPHTLSYFNEFVGGPRNGHRHLLNSNIDWGQDLLYLKKWIDENPDARPIYLAYFGTWQMKPIVERWPVELLNRSETVLLPGWYAVSLNELYGKRDELRFLRSMKPIHRAGYSILIFYVSEDVFERVQSGAEEETPERGSKPLCAILGRKEL